VLDNVVFTCRICGKVFSRVLYQEQCEKSHKVVYLPVLEEDLRDLIQFLFTGDLDLIPKRFYDTAREYFKRIHNP